MLVFPSHLLHLAWNNFQEDSGQYFLRDWSKTIGSVVSYVLSCFLFIAKYDFCPLLVVRDASDLHDFTKIMDYNLTTTMSVIALNTLGWSRSNPYMHVVWVLPKGHRPALLLLLVGWHMHYCSYLILWWTIWICPRFPPDLCFCCLNAGWKLSML